MEDTAIIDLYWKRDEQAIVETDQKYGKYCHTVAYNVLNDVEDSRECVNDTWLRAWNAMPDQRPAQLKPFLGRLTRWVSLDRRRREGRERGQEHQTGEDQANNTFFHSIIHSRSPFGTIFSGLTLAQDIVRVNACKGIFLCACP